MTLAAALNGNRGAADHPAVPLTAQQLAADAAACIAAGADELHLHPRDAEGRESLDPSVVDAVVSTVRRAAPVPIGVTTGAWIEPDPERRAALVRAWREPDFASVNLVEEGSELVMAALAEAGIGIEAGVFSVADAEHLAASGFGGRVARVLVEIVLPGDDPERAAREIDAALDRLGIAAPRQHHGRVDSTWGVLLQGRRLGHDLRIGLEDSLLLPDGSPAASNAALVAATVALEG